MLVGSHYRIGSFVYRNIISRHLPYSSIEKKLFQVGNMYPDFSKILSRIEHTVEGSAIPFQHYVQKVRDASLSLEERMVSMGVMCHYLSDSFCAYHSKEPFVRQSLTRHLFYEFKVHLVLLRLILFPRRLYRELVGEKSAPTLENAAFAGEKSAPTLENAVFVRDYSASSDKKIPDSGLRSFLDADTKETDLRSIHLSLLKDYHAQKSSIKTDIRYALKATLFSSALMMEGFSFKTPVGLGFNPAPTFAPRSSSLVLNSAPPALQPRHLQKQLPTS